MAVESRQGVIEPVRRGRSLVQQVRVRSCQAGGVELLGARRPIRCHRAAVDGVAPGQRSAQRAGGKGDADGAAKADCEERPACGALGDSLEKMHAAELRFDRQQQGSQGQSSKSLSSTHRRAFNAAM